MVARFGPAHVWAEGGAGADQAPTKRAFDAT